MSIMNSSNTGTFFHQSQQQNQINLSTNISTTVVSHKTMCTSNAAASDQVEPLPPLLPLSSSLSNSSSSSTSAISLECGGNFMCASHNNSSSSSPSSSLSLTSTAVPTNNTSTISKTLSNSHLNASSVDMTNQHGTLSSPFPVVSMTATKKTTNDAEVCGVSLLGTVGTTTASNSVTAVLCSSPSSASQSSTSTTVTPGHLLLNGLVVGCMNTGSNQHQHQSAALADDPRTLQLALELSMVSLNEASGAHSLSHIHHQQDQHQCNSPKRVQFDLNTLNAISVAVAAANNGNAHVHNGINHNNLNHQFATTASTSSVLLPTMEDRSKKSQNMTECVPVPSSEHVAEIVGRQGCKIKALRAKTNTYIKTPVRGEEPVFVVTGRKEDVAKAKREILSAADHFSLIRATRKPLIDCSVGGGGSGAGGCASGSSGGGSTKAPPGPPSVPGQVTIQVRVPYRVVGLVVGPKGATIKHIQQETHTYIVTPSREKEPIFEVTGLPENVQSARKQIEAHIALRTGNLQTSGGGVGGDVGDGTGAGAPLSNATDDITSMHTINTLSQILNDEINPDFLATLYKSGITAFDYVENAGSGAGALANEMNLNMVTSNGGTANNRVLMGSMASCSNFQIPNLNKTQSSDYFSTSTLGNDLVRSVPGTQVGSITLNHMSSTTPMNGINLAAIHTGTGNNMIVNAVGKVTGALIARSCSSASSTASSKSTNNGGSSSSTSTNSSRPELINIWKNLGDSLDIDEGIGESPSIWALPATSLTTLSGSNCSASTSISPTDSLLGETTNAAVTVGVAAVPNGGNAILQQQQLSSSSALYANMQLTGLRRECLVCSDNEVTAALVPCGHNLFCMECANRICLTDDATCPICNLTVYHAMRILA